MSLGFGPKHGDPPFDLPRGRSDLDLRVQVVQPGGFAAAVKLFLDDGGLREVPLYIHGVAVAPAGK